MPERDDRKLAGRLRRLEGKLQAAQARERKRRHRVESARIRGKGVKKAQRRLDEARSDVRSILERIERVAEQDAGPTSMTARALLDSELARADQAEVDLHEAEVAETRVGTGRTRTPPEASITTPPEPSSGAPTSRSETTMDTGSERRAGAVRRATGRGPAPAAPRTRRPTAARPRPKAVGKPAPQEEAPVEPIGPQEAPVEPERAPVPGSAAGPTDGPMPIAESRVDVEDAGPEIQPGETLGSATATDDQEALAASVVEVVIAEVAGDSPAALADDAVSLEVEEVPTPWIPEPEPSAPVVSTEPEPAETIEPAPPAETTETAETTEPAETTETAETTEPAETVEPAEVIEPAPPSEPAETVEPAEAIEPAPPSEPAETAEPEPRTEPSVALIREPSGPVIAPDAVVAAAVDIGANSVHLLVAVIRDHHLEPLVDESVFLGLGTAADSGTIGEANRSALVAALSGYADAARQLGARAITFVGTDPLRRAADSRRVVMEVERRTGVALHVLSQEEEACLNLIGVTGGAPVTTDLGVLDIGGGSSELVVAAPGKRPRAIPIPLGSARLTDRRVTTDPPTLEAIADLRSAARHEVEAAAPAVIHELVAVGGTATNLVRLSVEAMTDWVLDRTRLAGAIDALVAEPADAISERFMINPLRPRLLPAGAAIMEAVLDRYGLESVRVSDAGIREGAALVAAKAGDPWRDRLGELVNGWATDEVPGSVD